jgi:hypothetical protein
VAQSVGPEFKPSSPSTEKKKCKSKHLQETQTTNASKDVAKQEPLCAVGGNAN